MMMMETTSDLLQEIRSGASTLELSQRVLDLCPAHEDDDLQQQQNHSFHHHQDEHLQQLHNNTTPARRRGDVVHKICTELSSSAIQSIHLHAAFWDLLLEDEQRRLLMAIGSMQKLRSFQFVSLVNNNNDNPAMITTTEEEATTSDDPVRLHSNNHHKKKESLKEELKHLSVGFNLQITAVNLARLIKTHRALSSTRKHSKLDPHQGEQLRPSHCHPLLYSSLAPDLATAGVVTELRFLMFEPEHRWPSFDPVLDKVQALAQLPQPITCLHLDTVHWRQVWLALEQQQQQHNCSNTTEMKMQTLALQKELTSIEEGRALRELIATSTSLKTLLVSIRADMVEQIIVELAKGLEEQQQQSDNKGLRYLHLSCSGTPWAVRSLRQSPPIFGLERLTRALWKKYSLQIDVQYGDGNPPPDTVAHNNLRIQSTLNRVGRGQLLGSSGTATSSTTVPRTNTNIAPARQWVESLICLNDIHSDTTTSSDDTTTTTASLRGKQRQQPSNLFSSANTCGKSRVTFSSATEKIHLSCLYSLLRSNPSLCKQSR